VCEREREREREKIGIEEEIKKSDLESKIQTECVSQWIPICV